MRRFNYTGRRRIPQENVAIQLRSTVEQAVEASVDLKLSGLLEDGVDPEAVVFVEAYGGSKFERFRIGSLATASGERPLRLEQFRAGESVLFRVKVVVTGEQNGRIAAMATRITPRGPAISAQSSLLPVIVEPLEGVVFRVNFSDDGPSLILNKALDDIIDNGIKGAAHSSFFIAVVYPEVVRQILTRILVIERLEEDEEEGENAGRWHTAWLRYAQSLVGVARPESGDEGDNDEDLLEWIDAVTARFAARLHVLQKFEEAMKAAAP